MQPIQDKDFDQLFKNAFEDAEIEPSRDLWNSIESKIKPRQKRLIPVYWLSAAAVLLIATVGYLVYQQQEIKPRQLAGKVEQKKTKPVIESQSVKDAVKADDAPAVKAEQALPIVSKPVQAVAKNRPQKYIAPVHSQEMITAPETQKQQTVIAQVQTDKEDIKTKIEDAVAKVNTETVTASLGTPIRADEVTGDDVTVENKGIRNVGDVVNLIVNKVDKRKDKFIQFRTDDDDSSLSSINIGPFKFGKRKNNR